MSKEFTAKQKEIVARKLGYDGPMQGFDEFLQSSPALAMKYGMIADKYMAKGGMVKKYQAGGLTLPSDIGSYTTDQKADLYNQYLGKGYSDADIRTAAGQQTDENWQSLQRTAEARRAQQFATGTAASDEEIRGLYRSVLGREADAGGLEFYKTSNFSADQIRQQLVNSQEARERASKTTTNIQDLAKNATRGGNTGVTPMPGGVTDNTFGIGAGDTIDASVIVYGPDGKMYSSPKQARAAGVTNYTMTPPDQTAEEKKRINPADRSKEMANMPVGGSPTPGGSGGVKINIDPATATADQKAAEYNRLLSLGMTDAQIRAAAESQFGKQTADNWSELQRLSSTKGTTVPKATPGVEYGETGVPKAGAMQTVQAQQTQVTPQMQLDADQYAAGKTTAATVTTAQAAPEIAVPEAVTPRSVTAVQTRDIVEKALAPLTAAQGEAPVIEAAQLTPEQMQAAMAQAQTLDQARQVQLAQRRLQEGELVTGPAVDQQRVEQAIAQTQAAQGRVSEEMTVQGQLTKLTADFDTRNPPPWAAGAVRAATSMLAARGLGASSMAGQAIIQAAMESAIPIASADAAAYREMESQNLSNRQQVAVLSAQQRAQFLGQEFDQAFQTRVLNASKIADIANMNFTAEQQVYLENARLAQSVDLANLNNRQATVIANAATIANMETANLSARQQTRVANAQNFLQMSIANMNNQQQMALFKAQELTQSILSDAAAENTARQFNASSQQQADQFNTELATKVSEFNTAQKNAIEQFNAGEANALAKFNAEMENRREEFNVKNRTVIDQANAQLLAEISTANTAQVNAANFENARAMNNMTLSQYNNEVQLYRDQVKMVFDSYERAEDRAASMATAVLQAELAREKIDAETSSSFAKLVGSVLTGTKIGDSIIDAGKNFIKDLIGG